MQKKIKAIMAGAFRLPEAEIPDDAEMGNVGSWDSLGHLELMLALEAELGVRMPAETMRGLTSLKAIEAFCLTTAAQQ